MPKFATDGERQRLSEQSSISFRHVVIGLTALLCALVFGYAWRSYGSPTLDQLMDGIAVHSDMVEHSHEFDVPTVYKVTDGVFVAVGFACANSILLEGPDGLIIVDTTESNMAALEIYQEFRKVSPNKPIKAIVYTHNHYDHCLGTEAFLKNSTEPVDIWGHHTLKDRVMEFLLTGQRTMWGSRHQFGVPLGKHVVNIGIGPRLRYGEPGGSTFPLFPNRFITTQIQHETIAGLNVTFLHIPGETPDQIAVWLPDRRVLLPADDIYSTFPNLYAIRGTPPRDTTEWFRSLDLMRSLRAEHLVPSHTRPVSGADRIDELFRIYSASIEYVHDQTIRMMNRQLSPDEIGKAIHLPPDLATHRYLKEFYGTLEWSARGVYERYIGWFSGDPVDLRPLEYHDRARRYVELAGGTSKTLRTAEAAVKAGEYQWGLELATQVYRATGYRRKDGTWDGGREWLAAKDVKVKALRGLASRERNPIARNYYLTAMTAEYMDVRVPPEQQKQAVQVFPAKFLMDIFKVRLNPEKVVGADWTIVFNFTDVNETFVLRLRHCVLKVEEESAFDGSYDAKLSTDLKTWKAIVTRTKSPIVAYLSGKVSVTGSLWTLYKFLSSFDSNV